MARAASLGVAILTSLSLPTSQASAQSEDESPVAVEAPTADVYADTDPSALTDFRPVLDPYGTWANDPTYGTTWTPSPEAVGADFAPYDTAGRWDYTDGEYAWASDYSWGWVCFHYGRWVWSSGRWLWIPGREYAAAWVEWRVGDAMFGYIGWAPMPPAWTWVDGSAVGLSVSPPVPWSFAAYGDFLGPGISSRAIVGAPAVALVSHTRPYVRAQPTVAGQPAQPQRVMQGPPPAALGIDLSRIPRAAPNARELRARQYARPSTALALGARAPVRHFVQPAPVRAYAIPRAGIGPQVGSPKRR
jgi:hypothetical protein